MKLKILLFILVITSFQVSIYSQDSLGVIGGLNHSMLKISDKAPDVKIEYVNGYTLGLLINFDISESYTLSFQPRYIVKGEDVYWSNPALWDWAKNRFNYLELPIYFQARLINSNFKPFIFSGINIGYLFSATTKIKRLVEISSPFYIPEEHEIIEITVTDDYNKLDLAIDLGAGMEYLINDKYSLTMDIRYSLGLLNLSDEGTLYFRGLQVLLGFLYQL